MKFLYYRLTSLLTVKFIKDGFKSELKCSGPITELNKNQLLELFNSNAFRKGLPRNYKIEFHLLKDSGRLRIVFTRSPNESIEQRIRNAFRYCDYEKPLDKSNLLKK